MDQNICIMPILSMHNVIMFILSWNLTATNCYTVKYKNKSMND